MHHQIILCSLLCFIGRLGAAADPNFISINCGGAAPATARNGRKWGEDSALGGSSTAAFVERELITSIDPVPYSTARISRSQFSYSFHLTPGQKSIRLHFNPVSYHGFESFNDFFSVQSGQFTLLANFSASVTARALSLNVIVKEFCVHIKEKNDTLNLVFYPENRRWGNSYAFINGIDIISLPSMITGTGVPVLGHESVVYVDNSSALERVHYQHIKWGSFSSSDDIGGMFGMWAESSLKKNSELANPKTWRVSVDVGFMYLVRLHLCEVELDVDFVILINNIVAFTSVDMLRQRGSRNFLWYDDYMVMMEELKQEDDHDIFISVHSHHEFLDRHGPLEGFEVFKISNHDGTLASPRLLFPTQNLQTLLHSLQALLYNFHGHISPWLCYLCMNILSSMCGFIVFILENKMSEDNFTEKNNIVSFTSVVMLRQRGRRNFLWYNNYMVVNMEEPKQEDDHDILLSLQSHHEFLDRHGPLEGFEVFKLSSNDCTLASPRLLFPTHTFQTLLHSLQALLYNLHRCINLLECIVLLYICMLVNIVSPERKMFEDNFTEKDNKPLAWKKRLGRRLSLAEIQAATENFHDRFMCNRSEIVAIQRIKPEPRKQRLEICIGVGRALDYLHMGHRIVHRDFKASNILLDEKFVPNVKDFSLVKIGSGSESLSQDSKKFRGTFGYVDSTYFRTPESTEKSNIYSSDELLLEALCERLSLTEWVERDPISSDMWDPKFHCPVKNSYSELMQGLAELQSGFSISRFSPIKPLGYCWEYEEPDLFNEMMAVGRLRNHLIRTGSPYETLDQDIRRRIVPDIPRYRVPNMSRYLLDSSTRLVRIVKFSGFRLFGQVESHGMNLLLNRSFIAKLSDFGIARFLPSQALEDRAILEYIATARPYCMIDKCAIILEKLMGARALDHRRPPERHNLVEWMKLYLCNDQELKGTHPPISALLLALLDFNCLESEPEPKNRPSMQEMVDTLDRIAFSIERPRVYLVE